VKAVLDEGVVRLLAALLKETGLEVSTFPQSWKGLKNGELLKQVEQSGYDCLVTADKNLRWQQNLAGRPIAIVVLPGQRLERLRPIVPLIALTILNAKRGEATEVPVNNERSL
jgi:hypothetical protein